MRQQEIALKEREEAQRAEEEREKGIEPKKPEVPVSVEKEEIQEAEKPKRVFDCLDICCKRKKPTDD